MNRIKGFAGLAAVLTLAALSWLIIARIGSTDGEESKPQSHTIAAFIAKELAMGKKANRLIDEKSPYLLQHAFNPVDWYPWGEEAFAKARELDKPIFLSIGYSTCHWCHVMEEESFESHEIAEIMNAHFVNIKVDREERPDVDKVYMTATQAMTGGGGWPMSVFLTHDLKPFYTGTYFPPESRYGRPGFPEILNGVHRAWTDERDKVLSSAQQLTQHIATLAMPDANQGPVAPAVLDQAFGQFESSFDPRFGGFGASPKFPRPAMFNFLMRYYHRSKKDAALDMSLTTLKRMAEGGMHDQVGGGFHRYSVDAQWRVPHFEKMLYDQAQLAVAYLEAYQLTQDPVYSGVAQSTLDYVLRDMIDARGGFHSAEDADSPVPGSPDHKAEGVYYVWTQAEIEAVLGAGDAAIYGHHYGVEEDGNALADPQNEFVGKNILYIAHSIAETAQHFDRSPEEVAKIVRDGSRKLFKNRGDRPRPHLDDKVITGWNGLMIGAFARGYQVLDQSRYLAAATRAAHFIQTVLYEADSGLLLRRYRDGEAGLEAHLSDYAFLVQGLLDLYEASLDADWLRFALALTEKQIALFWDDEQGGFFDTSGLDESVLLRMKEDYDGAEPTGNSVAALNLMRLGQMTDNLDFQDKASRTIAVFSGRLAQFPSSLPQLLAAFDFQQVKPKQIIIAGSPDAEDTRAMIREVHQRYLPNKILLLADGLEAQDYLSAFLPFVKNVAPLNGKATAFVCQDYVCKLPTSDMSTLIELLDD